MAKWEITCKCGRKDILEQEFMSDDVKQEITLAYVNKFICSDCFLEEVKNELSRMW